MKVAGIDPTTNQWKHASIIEDGAKNRLCVDASFTAAQIKIWDGTDTLEVVNFADVWDPGTTDITGLAMYGWDSDNNRAVPFQFNNAGELITSASVSIEKVKIWDGTHYLDVFIPGEAFTLATSTGLATGGHDYAGGGAEVYYPIKVDSSGNQYINLQDGSGTGITSTLIGAKQSLDINVAGGTIIANIEGDYVDDSAFTVATDKGLMVGGFVTSDSVDIGDFGAFRMNAAREQYVQAKQSGAWSVTAAVTGFITDDDDGAIASGQTLPLNINELYGYHPGTTEWHRAEIDTTGNLKVRVSDGTNESHVTSTIMAASIDESNNALLVQAGVYGYYAAGGANALGRPLLMDLEDGLVASGQIPQVVINENYVYSSKVNAWIRWDGDGGYAFVLSRSEYPDDDTFTVESDYGSACGGVFSADTVDANDFGVFAINAAREQLIQAKQNGVWDIGTLGTITNEVDVDVNSWSLGAATTLGKIIITDGAQDCAVVDNGDAWQPGVSDHPGIPIYGYDTNNLAVPFKFNAAGNLMVDTEFVSDLDVYVEGDAWTLATSTGLGVGGHDYVGGAAEVWSPIKVDTEGHTTSIVTGWDIGGGVYKDVHVIDTGAYNALTTILLDGAGTPVVITQLGSDALANSHNELITGSMTYAFNGTTWDRMRGTIADGQLVNLGTNNDVTLNDGTDTLDIFKQADAYTLATSTGTVIGGHDYAGGAAEVFYPVKVNNTGELYVNGISGAVTIAGMVFDDDDGSVAAAQTPQLVLSESLGFDTGGGDWQRFLVELDDDSIADSQMPQLVIPLLYGYDAIGGSWERIQTDGTGAMKVDATVNVTINSEYVDDSGFTVEVDKGLAVGGVFSADQVDANDFGVFAINADREQLIQAKQNGAWTTGRTWTLGEATDDILIYGWDGAANQKILTDNTGALQVDVLTIPAVTVTGFNTDTDDDSIALAQTSQLVISQLYGYDKDTGNTWERIETDGLGNVRTRITDGATDTVVALDFLSATQDEQEAGLITVSGCYGRYVAGGANAMGMPLLMDLDDGAFAGAQVAQVVLGASYGWNAGAGVPGWYRFQVDEDDDVVAGGQTVQLGISELYGWDGAQWERIQTDGSGALDVKPTGGIIDTVTSITNEVDVDVNSWSLGAATTLGFIKITDADGDNLDIVNYQDVWQPGTTDRKGVPVYGYDTNNQAVPLKFNNSGELMVDAEITNEEIKIWDGTHVLDVYITGEAFTLATSTGLATGGHDYAGGAAEVWNPIQVGATGKQFIDTIDAVTSITNEVDVDVNRWSLGAATTLGFVKLTDPAGHNLDITAAGKLNVDTVDTLTTITNNVNTNLFDGAGVAITSTLIGADQSLDVNITTASVTIDGAVTVTGMVFDTDDDSVADSQVPQLVLPLNYGYNGAAWERMLTDGNGYQLTGLVDAAGNRMPSMDVVGRAGYTYITDGANTMPTMDVAARKGFVQITDGTDSLDVWKQGDAYTLATSTALTIGGHDYAGGAAEVFNPIQVSATGKLFIEDINTITGTVDTDVTAWSLGAATTLGFVKVTDAAGHNLDVTAAGKLNIDTVDTVTTVTAVTDITNNVNTNLFDGAAVALTSTLIGADQSLDVNITTASVTIDGAVTITGMIFDTDDDSIAGAQINQNVNALAMGWDGANWERLQTDASGALDVKPTGGIIDTVTTITNEVDVDVNNWSLGGVTQLGKIILTDGADDAGIVATGDAIAKGLFVYGFDEGTNLAVPFKFNNAGELKVDAEISAEEVKIWDGVHTLDVYIQGEAWTLATSTGLGIGGHDYAGGAAEVWSPIKVGTTGKLFVDTVDTITSVTDIVDGHIQIWDGATTAAITSDFLATNQDERENGLVVTAGCYAHYPAAGVGTKAVALMADSDDDSIGVAKVAQIVLPLNYGFDAAGGSWERLQTDGSGGMFVYDTHIIYDTDDNSVADSQTPQLTLPLNYAYDSIGGVWERVLADGAGNQYAHITDGTNDMGVATVAGALVNGIADYGFEATIGVQVPKPLWAITGVAPNDYINPIGGHDYVGANTARVLKVDTNGEITSHISDGTDELDVWKQGDAYTLATSTALTIGGHDYAGGAAEVFQPLKVDSLGEITVSDITNGIDITGMLFDTDDGSIARNQVPQLVLNEAHAYYPATTTWGRMLLERDDGVVAELSNTLLTIDKNYGYNTAATEWYRLLVDVDDNAVADSQTPQLVMPLNYTYDSAGGVWERTLQDGAGNQYAHITDGTNDLDVVPAGAAITTGIVAMGEDVSANTTIALPLHNHAFASANYDVHFPMGGISYTGPPSAAYMIKVDSGGAQYSKITDGTDQLDICPSGVVPSNGLMAMALNTSLPAPDDAQFLVIHAEGAVTTRDYSLPVGGTDYAAPDSAYTIKVDATGSQFFELTGITNTTLINASEDETIPSIPVSAGAYGYYAAGGAGALARPLLMDLDDGGILAGQIAQTNINLNYGVSGAGWVRQPAMEVVTNPGYVAISDGVQMLDVQQSGSALGTGVLVLGELGLTASSDILPINQVGLAVNTKHLPVGGRDYTTGFASYLDVDTLGRISIRDFGTDRSGTAQAPSQDVSSRAVHTAEAKPEIFSDDWLHWYDDMETKSGAGCRICKWLPGLNQMPFNQGVGTSTVGYVETGNGDTIPPKEGNWMLQLKNVHPSEGTAVGCDAYTKLGEIDEKRVSMELWMTGVKTDQEFLNDTAFAFGFYQFYTNAAATQSTMRTFLIRYFIPAAALPEWQYYDAGGGWTTIAVDPRPAASMKNADWNANDYFCWHYLKLTVNLDYADDGTYNYESFTFNDTTWAIDAACETTALGATVDMSALCPYVYGRAPATLYDETEEEYQAFTYVDAVKVYCNDLQEYGGDPNTYGQKTGPGA